jgi:hypothetical protein
MEGSRLPLRTWFRAILEVLVNPQIRPKQLQEAVDVPRLGTVRNLIYKILKARESPDADRLLVRLQRHSLPVPSSHLKYLTGKGVD